MTDDRPKLGTASPDEQRRQAIVEAEREKQHRLIKRLVFSRKRHAVKHTTTPVQEEE